MKIDFISRNKDGNWYIGYKIKVQRGIKGKTKSKVDELIIVGINDKYFDDYCRKENLDPVAIRNDEAFVIKEKNNV